MSGPRERPLTVLVTGVGAIIGQGIIKSIRAMEGASVRVVGVDCNEHAVGLRWSDARRVVPRVDAPGWADAFVAACAEEEVDLVLPGIEQDVRALVRHRARIERETPALLLVNSDVALRAGFDKWELHELAGAHGVLVPRTWLARDPAASTAAFPVLLKPRHGMAGQGILPARSREELLDRLVRLPVDEYLVQEHVGTDDEEFTVGLFGCADGAVVGPIALRRRLSYGSTFEAETVELQALASSALDTARMLGARGPTNLQYRRAGERFYLLEVNPRFSSSTSIKAAFGFNEAEMAIRSFVLKEAVAPPPLRAGRCSRYIEDQVTYS